MLNVDLNLPISKIYIRLLNSSVLAIIGLTVGLVPEIAAHSPDVARASVLTVSRSHLAYAQEFTPEETENYARAGYQVELLRRQVYQEIKSSMKQPPPEIVCDRQETLDSLPSGIREIANRYCDRSREIVQQNNLTVDRFNELKTFYDRQQAFYQQVQNILLKLQN